MADIPGQSTNKVGKMEVQNGEVCGTLLAAEAHNFATSCRPESAVNGSNLTWVIRTSASSKLDSAGAVVLAFFGPTGIGRLSPS